MPLIQIRQGDRISDQDLERVIDKLPNVAAHSLSCPEGGPLTRGEIMIQVEDVSLRDRNMKDLNMLVFAHDYPSRNERLDEIRKDIAAHVKANIGPNISWNVWVILAPTSYGSDTEN